jgi:chaperonin GroES
MPRRNQPAASSFQTPPKKSPHRARSSPSAPAAVMRPASSFPSTSKSVDRVLFGKWSGTEVKIDGQELLIMKESDIMGIIDEPVAKKKAA